MKIRLNRRGLRLNDVEKRIKSLHFKRVCGGERYVFHVVLSENRLTESVLIAVSGAAKRAFFLSEEDVAKARVVIE